MIDVVRLVGHREALKILSPDKLVGEWNRGTRKSPFGGTETFFRTRDEGLDIDWCPEHGQLDLRINISRITNSTGLNYPLVPFERWDRVETARTVVTRLGCPSRKIGIFAEEWADDFLDFGVREVSYAVDVPCVDIPEVLTAISTIPSRTKVQVWGHPYETVQWNSKGRNLQFYDKAKELRSVPKLHRGRHKANRAIREQVARLAEFTLRVEATYRGAGQTRKLGEVPQGHLPTLNWVARSDLGAYALTREMGSLGILDLAPGDSTEVSFAELCRVIAANSESIPGGRSKLRASASPTRILAAAAYLSLEKELSRKQMREDLRFTDSTFKDLNRFIKDIGLPRCGMDNPRTAEKLQEFSEAFLSTLGARVEYLDERDVDYFRTPWCRSDQKLPEVKPTMDYSHLEVEYVSPDELLDINEL